MNSQLALRARLLGPIMLALSFLLPALQAKAADQPITGQVLDPEKHPVPGATVLLCRPYDSKGAHAIELARDTTDAQGHFTIKPPDPDAEATNYQRGEGLTLWVDSPKHQPLARGGTIVQLTANPLELTLSSEGQVAVEIKDSDGKPLPGARVAVLAIPGNLGFLPKPTYERTKAVTDAQGRVTLNGFTPAQVAGLLIETDTLGTQRVVVDTPTTDTQWKVKLQPVATIAGQVTADDPSAPLKRSLTISSRPETPDSEPFQFYTNETVNTDQEGRFSTVVPAGTVSFQMGDEEGDPAIPFVFDNPEPLTVKPGATTDLKLQLKPGRPIRGLVREKESGQPIPGVMVHAIGYPRGSSRPTKTDDQGNFEIFHLPGKVRVQPFNLPAQYLTQGPTYQGEYHELPDDPAGLTIPPIELLKGRVVRGKVVDEQGKPAPGARVSATWIQTQGQGSWQGSAATIADREGRFTLEAVHPEPASPIRLNAFTDDAAPEAPLILDNKNDEVTLTVSKANKAVLSGRVVDDKGLPVAFAPLFLFSQTPDEKGNSWSTSRVSFEDTNNGILLTDAEGRFRTPQPLNRFAEYQATVQPKGFLETHSPWFKPGDDPSPSMPDIKVKRLRNLAGIVKDHQGQPVAGVELLRVSIGTPSSPVTSDAEGRFLLTGLLEAPALIVARKDGFKTFGQKVAPEDQVISLTLTRVDEVDQSSRILKTLPVLPESKDEALTLARRLTEPDLAHAADPKVENRPNLLTSLAALYPEHVLEAIETQPFENPWFNDYVRHAVAKGLLQEAPDDAAAIVEAMQDPQWRPMGRMDLADALPENDKAGKLVHLRQAIVDARGIVEPEHRVTNLAMIAERLLNLGEQKLAADLLRDTLPVAQQLNNSEYPGYARGLFAEPLSRVDLDAALALIKDLTDPFEVDRHHGNIAHKLAATDPATAEKLIAEMKEPFRRDQWTARVCYRMAPVDLETATRIAQGMENKTGQAYALGMIALALHEHGRNDEALVRIKNAFDADRSRRR